MAEGKTRKIDHFKIQGPLWAILATAIYNLGDKITQKAPTTGTEWAVAVFFAISGATKPRQREVIK